MMSNRLAILALAGLLALTAYELYADAVQEYKINRFMNQGQRFTAADGQALCERVRALEQESEGYRNAGKAPPACTYGMIR